MYFYFNINNFDSISFIYIPLSAPIPFQTHFLILSHFLITSIESIC